MARYDRLVLSFWADDEEKKIEAYLDNFPEYRVAGVHTYPCNRNDRGYNYTSTKVVYTLEKQLTD